MIESPMIREWQAMALQEGILEFLKGHFGKVPRDLRKLLRETKDPKRLTKLCGGLFRCKTADDVKEALFG